MKTSKTRLWYNNIHFLAVTPLLVAYSFKYPIFILFLILYLIYIYKKRIFIKPILLITVIASIIFFMYNFYTPKQKDNFDGIVISEKDNRYEVFNGLYSTLIYSDEEINIGDVINISGTSKVASKESYEAGFSYKEYLKQKRIYYIYYNPKIQTKNHIWTPLNLRNSIEKDIEEKLDDVVASYVEALLLGDNKIDNTTKGVISDLGISHLFAISGFHVALFFMFFSLVLKWISNEDLRNNIIILIFLFYVFFTGFQISILRSVIMIILKILSNRYNRLYTSLDNLSSSILLSGLINPGYFYMTSFKLTYLITFFLIISSKLVTQKYKSYKIGLIAFLSSLPLVININYKINLLAILLVPAASYFIGYILIPYLALVLVLPILINIKLINIFEKTLYFISKIDFLTITFKHLNIYFIILYYLFFIFTLILIETKNKNKKMYLPFVFYILMLSLLHVSSFYYQIEFIDVGQGDSILITSPHNKEVILVDTFGYNTSYIKSRGIKKIDYLLITHSDNDHIGGIDDTLKNFKVKNIISSAYDNIDYDSTKVLSGNKISLDNLTLDIYGPIYKNSDINNNSIVFMLNIYGYKILFTGDMESAEEETLINKYQNSLKADVLKVGHHGSSTSSTKDFIKYVNPKYAVISCGVDNKYGFPHEEALNNLCKAKIYRTDIGGNISLKIKNHKIDITSYK